MRNQAYSGNAQKGHHLTAMSPSYDVQHRNTHWDIPYFHILITTLPPVQVGVDTAKGE